MFKPYESHTPMQISTVKLGEYKVCIFPIQDVEKKHWCHTNADGTECPIYGYMVYHKELPSPLIYVTDCKYIKWNFQKQRPYVLLIGVDYQEDLLNKDKHNYVHVLTGHMSLETAKAFISANKTDDLNEVIIGHMSAKNSSNETFINELNKVANNPIKLAYKGMQEELSLPFS